MRIADLANSLPLTMVNLATGDDAHRDLRRCYAGDVLSEALAHAPRHGIFLTVQTHPATIAVAAQRGVAAIIFTAGNQPDHDSILAARRYNIALASTDLDSFEACGRLWSAGLRGGTP